VDGKNYNAFGHAVYVCLKVEKVEKEIWIPKGVVAWGEQLKINEEKKQVEIVPLKKVDIVNTVSKSCSVSKKVKDGNFSNSFEAKANVEKKKDFKKIDPGVKKVVNIEVSKVVEVDKTAQKPGMGSKQQHGLEGKKLG